MKIYLVRHGDSHLSYNDDKRQLSPLGINEVNAMAAFLIKQPIHVKKILHSHKMRAKQTAELLASAIQSYESIQEHLDLNPMSSIETLLKEIHANQDDMMLVGHMPFMGMLVSRLITGKDNYNVVMFKTACVVCLEQINDESWIISWMLSPELFLH